MKEHILTALYLSLPLVLSGILHMAVVKFDLLSALKKPLSAPLFGANKTLRGLILFPILTVGTTWLVAFFEPRESSLLLVRLRDGSPTVLGFALGLAYVLAELPNSYIKRRLAVKPGMLPDRNRLVFAMFDQADSAFGCAIAYLLLRPVPTWTLVCIVLLGPTVHLVVNVSLYCVGLRERPI